MLRFDPTLLDIFHHEGIKQIWYTTSQTLTE